MSIWLLAALALLTVLVSHRHDSYVSGLSDGVTMTEQQWQLYMKTHCVCWFNDSRCSLPRPVAVCQFPEAMKGVSNEKPSAPKAG